MPRFLAVVRRGSDSGWRLRQKSRLEAGGTKSVRLWHERRSKLAVRKARS